MEKGGDDGEGGFLAARSLRTGDQLRLGDGSPAYVTSVEATGIIEPVYNFSVDGWKTYHVGELGVWVHNVCIDDIPRFGFSPYNLAQKDAINQTRVLIRNGANADSVPEAIRAQWGKEFRNDYGDLPTRIGGSPVQGYREYTIDPGPFNQADRGSHLPGTPEDNPCLHPRSQAVAREATQCAFCSSFDVDLAFYFMNEVLTKSQCIRMRIGEEIGPIEIRPPEVV